MRRRFVKRECIIIHNVGGDRMNEYAETCYPATGQQRLKVKTSE